MNIQHLELIKKSNGQFEIYLDGIKVDIKNLLQWDFWVYENHTKTILADNTKEVKKGKVR